MAEPTKEELLFGKIALHNKLIAQEHYDEALRLRKLSQDVNADFGRLLKAAGAIDDKQYRTIRKAQEKHLIGKGSSPEEAKFLARGLNADGSMPGGGAAPAAEPAPAPAPAEFAPEPAEFAPDDTEEFAPDEVVEEEPVPVAPVMTTTVAAEPKQLHKRPVDQAARKTMVALFKKAREAGASDIHMSCGAKPFFRLNGGMTFLNMPEITPEVGAKYAASIMDDAQWQHFMETNDWDGSVQLPKDIGRFRANILRNRNGVSAVYRVINTVIPSFKKLGLPETLERFTTYHQGLVLVTGGTGSGKSSTLAAMIDMINENRKDHIITLEDPIEYVFTGKSCNITQRQVGEHTKSWGNALRAALREDPDVIMIGEMRDLESIQLAITAAETGHLVFGTLHTTSATRTIDRLLDVFPPGEQSQIRAMVSESLKGIVSQQLLPKADGKGRALCQEILFWTPAVANLIREGTTFKLHSVLQTGKKLGMSLMDESIRKLLDDGVITKEVARGAASNPRLFK